MLCSPLSQSPFFTLEYTVWLVISGLLGTWWYPEEVVIHLVPRYMLDISIFIFMVTCHVFIQGKKKKDKVVATTPGSSQSLLDRWEKRHNWWYCKFGYPYSLLLKNYHYWKTGYQHMSRTVSILLLLQQQGIHPVIKLVMLLRFCIYYGLKTGLSHMWLLQFAKFQNVKDFQSTVDSFMVWAGWCDI